MDQPVERMARRAHDALMALGFGNYEARAYCALLARSPANGYQVARASGIPRAKIYECLERLVVRGAAVPVESKDSEARCFAATDPVVLIDAIAQGFGGALDMAREALAEVRQQARVAEVLWRVTSQQNLIQRGRRLAEKARRTLHVALWAEEFGAMADALLSAGGRGVAIALILYDPHPQLDDLQRQCPGVVLHSNIKRQAVPVMGRQFVLVADHQRCITGSIFPGADVEGVYTLNLGLVTNAVDLVNHEIYLERVIRDVGAPVARVFGKDLQRLDPFRLPESF